MLFAGNMSSQLWLCVHRNFWNNITLLVMPGTIQAVTAADTVFYILSQPELSVCICFVYLIIIALKYNRDYNNLSSRVHRQKKNLKAMMWISSTLMMADEINSEYNTVWENCYRLRLESSITSCADSYTLFYLVSLNHQWKCSVKGVTTAELYHFQRATKGPVNAIWIRCISNYLGKNLFSAEESQYNNFPTITLCWIIESLTSNRNK